MTAAVLTLVSLGVLAVPLLVGMAVWLGLRDGDRDDDVRSWVSVTAEDDGVVAWIDVTNPHRSPVVVSARARPASRLRVWLGSPLSVRTTRTPWRARASVPAGEVLGTVEGHDTAGWSLPLARTERPRAVRVEVRAYQRRGRVRVATHTVELSLEALSASRSAVPSRGSW